MNTWQETPAAIGPRPTIKNVQGLQLVNFDLFNNIFKLNETF